jgi:hypothetical protein
MKALTWHGRGDIRCDSVPDPKIQTAVTPSSRILLKVTFSVPLMTCLVGSAHMVARARVGFIAHAI